MFRSRYAELLYASTAVEPVSFNRGYFTVDIRFFYRIIGEATTVTGQTLPITGLATFDKRVMLFGSEGNAKVFTSDTIPGTITSQTVEQYRLPTAVVEAVDPIILDLKFMDACQCVPTGYEVLDVPSFISEIFDGQLVLDSSGRRLFVTLGQFSIVRLERDSQLLMPVYDYCLPDKECVGTGSDDPCTMFLKNRLPCG